MKSAFSLLLWLAAIAAAAPMAAEDSVAELARVPAAARTAASGRHLTDAVVQVLSARGAGCGTLIRVDDGVGQILTAAHVVQGSAACRIVWHDGTATAARVAAADAVLDVALLVGEAPPDAATIPLAGENQWPARGDVVELIGYGGGRLRHWQAAVNGYALTGGTGKHQTLSVDTQTIGGDSGGAMIFRQRLVGVIWGGPLAGPLGPMTATHGTCCVAIQSFLKRAAAGDARAAPPDDIVATTPPCRGPHCPLVPPARKPPSSPQSPLPSAALREIERLSTEIARLERQIAELRQPTPIEIDVQAIVAALVEQMAHDERFRGPPGKDGRDGADGRDGVDGQSAPAAPDIERLAEAVKQRISGSIRVRVEPLR
jgi:hypothetical protein